MSKILYDAARKLIAEKQYADARVVLKVIDEPRARNWEAKLNEIDPLPSRVLKNPLAGRGHLKRNVIVIILIGVVFGLLVLNMIGENSPSVVSARQTQAAPKLEPTDTDLTVTAYFLNYVVTNTPTSTPPPTPLVEVTLVLPRTLYVSNDSFRECPLVKCASVPVDLGTFGNEPVTVVGVIYGSWVNRSNIWYKIQFLHHGILTDAYAPSIDFRETPYQ